MRTGIFLAILLAAPAYADGGRDHRHGYNRAWGLGGGGMAPLPQALRMRPSTVYGPDFASGSLSPVTSYYYCAASDAFSPYVSACPSGWKTVTMNDPAEFDRGMAAFRNQDFATALAEWRPLAILGDAMAQFSIGTIYENGYGIPQDHQQAMKWFRLAAGQGRADAQNNLGVMYEVGLGVPQSYNEAIIWYRLAADQGYADAQFNLGEIYANGLGVTQNHEEAVKLYRLAAEQGSADSQFALGTIYENGQGVAQDYREAVKWYRLAADQGYADAQYKLGEMYANKKGVPQSRVIAFALYNLSTSNVPATDNTTTANLEKLSSSMTTEEIAAGQLLLLEISKPGMLLQVLDRFINQSAGQENALPKNQ